MSQKVVACELPDPDVMGQPTPHEEVQGADVTDIVLPMEIDLDLAAQGHLEAGEAGFTDSSVLHDKHRKDTQHWLQSSPGPIFSACK